jgi:heterodisulfide reductase subunit C
MLIAEIYLLLCIFSMNGADVALQLQKGLNDYGFAISSNIIGPALQGLPTGALVVIERLGWWGHIIGVLALLVYITYSKHLHIMLAFPNTYFSRLEPKGEIKNMPEITKEVKSMLDPNLAFAAAPEGEAAPRRFGAKDVNDLSWKNLLDAYSCTECGRCTDACPANGTGKLLSPRKIMMDTRDRLDEVGKNIDTHGPDFVDNKALLGDYISVEELRACTTCNACVQECPINISPLDIIVQLRRYLIMEESNSPEEWNMMFGNIENNGAPWKFSPDDRFKWAEEVK